jgi:hypothetical protein
MIADVLKKGEEGFLHCAGRLLRRSEAEENASACAVEE